MSWGLNFDQSLLLLLILTLGMIEQVAMPGGKHKCSLIGEHKARVVLGWESTMESLTVLQ